MCSPSPRPCRSRASWPVGSAHARPPARASRAPASANADHMATKIGSPHLLGQRLELLRGEDGRLVRRATLTKPPSPHNHYITARSAHRSLQECDGALPVRVRAHALYHTHSGLLAGQAVAL